MMDFALVSTTSCSPFVDLAEFNLLIAQIKQKKLHNLNV